MKTPVLIKGHALLDFLNAYGQTITVVIGTGL